MEQQTVDLLTPFRLRDPDWVYIDRKSGKKVNLYRAMAKLSMDLAFGQVSQQDRNCVFKALGMIADGLILDKDLERAELAFLLLQGLGRV